MGSFIPLALPGEMNLAWLEKHGVKEWTVEHQGPEVFCIVDFMDGASAVYGGAYDMKPYLNKVTWPDGTSTSFTGESLSSMFSSGAANVAKIATGVIGTADVQLKATSVDNHTRANRLASRIPGVQNMVTLPCACPELHDRSVWMAVQHLNDRHHPEVDDSETLGDIWTRERIADWLETLDVDLSVQPEPAPAKPVRGPHESALSSCLCPQCTPSASDKIDAISVAFEKMQVSAEELHQQLGVMGQIIKEQQHTVEIDLALYGSSFVGPMKGVTAEFVAEDEPKPDTSWLDWKKVAGLAAPNVDSIKELLEEEPPGQKKEES